MKKLYIILISVSLLLSCSGDDGTISIPDLNSINLPPTVPSLVFPIQHQECTNFNLNFDWNAAIDEQGDKISYIIEIATDDTFNQVLFTSITPNTSQVFTLEKGTVYFWRVKAMDDLGNESNFSPTQSFYTEPDAGVNTLPTPPALVAPTAGSNITGTTIILDWNATDSDGDALLYDLYFGDTNPPIRLAENLDSSSFEVNININTTYYWRVVVKDSNQGVAMGQIWDFRTQ